MRKGRDIAVALITARETAKQVAKELVKPVTVVIQPISPKETFISSEGNVTVNGFKEVLDKSAEGELKNLLLITNSSSYKIRLIKDGDTLYDAQFSWFQSITQEVENISAFTELDSDGAVTGNYVLSLKNIAFLKHIRVLMEVTTPIIISTLYYELLVNKSS